ncbi:MAG: bifunctional (p)ppGpp synthetase/guanosine-3',5'-bis(diphosphate) 3'-pyrophosphohydrolase [Deltaproteobacteria bacterium]|nr:bifunctional (p)ppGpp synthetase/guanosine-3',5'-bis(diphosphate) 3'-pyrophosphohydrolase [Deltaproteobacteria bacterium]
MKAVTIDEICNAVLSYYPEAPADGLRILRGADEFAERVHGSQRRHSGEPYMVHPRLVAMILTELRLDIPSIATAILHDTVEDTHATLEDIENNFGPTVAGLVDGVTKLSKITFKTSEEKQAENFRKMIIAMAKDIRVILVKLADRLHNMRTLEHLLPYKQKLIAQETLDIYAPIANRLGISSLKTELEDHCLRYLHPDIYYKLAAKVSKSRREREKYIEEVTTMIQEKLKEYDLNGSVIGRSKHFYSIYKKMERRKIEYDQLHDVIAFRILLDNITECYKALGVIHATYKPVQGRFKDYIAIPKANQYQSLHTTVIGPQGERIEIQIRTHDMNDVAEHGIAAHWIYKEGKLDGNSRDVQWVNRLLEWHKDLKDPNEFLETVKIDLFAEDVYVFTPKGDVMEFPHGATPLDFAYAIHSDVGNHCVGAKVNGKIVPLKYRLKSGDTLEILTSPTQTPNKDWLKLVKTSKAKSRIRAYIKTQERVRATQLGREIIEKEFKAYGQKIAAVQKTPLFEEFLKKRAFKTPEDLFIYVGYGRLQPAVVALAVLQPDVLAKKVEPGEEKEPSFLNKVFESARNKIEGRNAITVDNIDNILIRFGRCCNPIPGDNIVGFVTRGRGITVHTVNCQKALDFENERRVDVRWNLRSPVKRHVRIKVLSHDMPGILADMSQSIAGCAVNISKADIRTTKDRKAICNFEIEVSGLDQLSKVISALEAKKFVINVERVRA